MDKQIFDCFEYYYTSIQDRPEDVQSCIGRFLTLLINKEALTDRLEVEDVFVEQIQKSFKLDPYDLMENKDRFVPSEKRLMGGEYFTPERMARFGREVVKDTLNIKDYYIWDVSCGSGNLWRTEKDYDSQKLFMSTLNQSDVDLIRNTGMYPDDVTVFTCDFLQSCDLDIYNTPFLNSLPEKLQEVIRENKPLLFFFNPPFKAGVTTPVSRHMSEVGLGRCSTDLYMQFIFKVIDIIDKFNLTNAKVAVYSPVSYIKNNTGMFDYVQSVCNFDGAYLFSSTSFSDTSDTGWFIAFAMFSHKTSQTSMANRKINFINVTKFGKLTDDYEITTKNVIELEEFQVQDQSMLDWANTNIEYYLPRKSVRFFDKHGNKTIKLPITENTLGYLSGENQTVKNKQNITIMSGPQDFQSFIPITNENVDRVFLCFCAFRTPPADNNMTITNSYVIAPKEKLPEELLVNMPFLALYEQKSFQFSNTLTYPDGETLKYPNAMFYMDREQILEYAIQNEFDAIAQSAQDSENTNEYMMNKLRTCLQSEHLWDESRKLYEYMCDITLDTMKYRADAPEEYGLNNWDAGWIQIRYMLKTVEGGKEILAKQGELLFAVRDKIFEILKGLGIYAYDN